MYGVSCFSSVLESWSSCHDMALWRLAQKIAASLIVLLVWKSQIGILSVSYPNFWRWQVATFLSFEADYNQVDQVQMRLLLPVNRDVRWRYEIVVNKDMRQSSVSDFPCCCSVPEIHFYFPGLHWMVALSYIHWFRFLGHLIFPDL